ncbi:MAG: tetratricopeptide repeat protein [Planctomycetes bacterium]|nr:tetratricopeptide repeat protein [Planctomycetota bacterium]
MRHDLASITGRLLVLLVLSAAGPLSASIQARPTPQEPSAADREALAEERAACALLLRRGAADAAIRRLGELLAEDPADAEALALRARARLEAGDPAAAAEDARAALAVAGALRAVRAAALRVALEAGALRGDPAVALAAAEAESGLLEPSRDARDAWAWAVALLEAGRREGAVARWREGAGTGADQPWDGLVARAACQRRLGRLEAASQSLIAALEAGPDGEEPDALAALGDLYFEADREVERAKRRSAAQLYDAALARHATHEGALLGLFQLHRTNWMRQRRSAGQFLETALSARPRAVETLLAAASADVDDGLAKSSRERLALLQELAPRRRAVRALAAAIQLVDRETARAEALLGELAAEDPGDSGPEREAGRHLLELYRFAEGLPYLRRAVERDPLDWEAWKELGRALANTGDEQAAREALERANVAAAGRQDAWRDNMRLVLARTAERHGLRTQGDLSFSWEQEGDAVLSEYLIPFYVEARAELARRYGFTPTPTAIQVFRRHRDFSVRSTGFEGFPALGVCFGPVVTAVSPLAEMRGTNSWARTSFHEFTHVIHLGLSHNRCPRWITEGLATWEEVHRNPSWTRNMRRELVDALACGELIRVREMNRAFRGPRILFGYYQAGLVCTLLVERHGFPSMVRLLAAFDRGLDLDAALSEVFGTTPEALDRDFEAWARAHVAGLAVEPRWSADFLRRAAVGLAKRLPRDEAQRDAWQERWITQGYGAWQQGRKVDAIEALRVAREHARPAPRAALLQAEIALSDGDSARAEELFRRALELGGEDYRARMVLASLARARRDLGAARRELEAAERAFPGWDDVELSAELALADLHAREDREDDSMAARERWLAWNAGDATRRRAVAAWHVEHGRLERAIALYAEANEVDPFLRGLHRAWGDALRTAGRPREALREYRMALAVPAELDVEDDSEWTPAQRAELLALQAASHEALGEKPEALARAREALELDPDSALAREVVDRIQ